MPRLIPTDGKNIELQASETAIEWRIEGDATWQELVPLSDITGGPGPAGADGADGLIQSIVAGTNTTVDSTDPAHPVISATGGMDPANNLSDVDDATLSAGNLDLIERDTVALLLADTILDYSVGGGKTAVATNQIVKAGGFRYKVAASGASDHHLTTAGGVKLYVMADGQGVVAADALDIASDGSADETTKIETAIDVGTLKLADGGDYRADGLNAVRQSARIIGPAKLYTSVANQNVLMLQHVGNTHIEDALVEGVEFSQPHYADIGPGLLDDMAALKFRGARNAAVRSMRVKGADSCLHYGIGTPDLTDEIRSVGCNTVGLLVEDIYGMGLELFGVLGGSHTGLTFLGSGDAYTYDFAAADVNAGADTITLASLTNASVLANTYAVKFSTTGTLPAPLVAGTIYYVAGRSGTSIKLAASYADASAGTPVINLTDGGAGTHTITAHRTIFHGVRFASFDYAPNEGIFVQAHAERFSRGVSIQQNTHGCTAIIDAKDCAFGAEVHGKTENVPMDNVSTGNKIFISARGGDMGVISGGSHNDFFVDVDGASFRGVYEQPDGGDAWLSDGNGYFGSVRNIPGRSVWLRGKNGRFDLDVAGINTTDTPFGLLLDGSGYAGKARIKTAIIGAQIGGSNNTLDLTIENCTTGLTVSGSGNVIVLNTSLPISISGDNNKIIGKCGTIANTGTGNDLSGLASGSGMGTFSGTTDANGFLTVNHSLGGLPVVVIPTSTDNNSNFMKVTARATTTFTVRVWNGTTPVASTAVNGAYFARL